MPKRLLYREGPYRLGDLHATIQLVTGLIPCRSWCPNPCLRHFYAGPDVPCRYSSAWDVIKGAYQGIKRCSPRIRTPISRARIWRPAVGRESIGLQLSDRGYRIGLSARAPRSARVRTVVSGRVTTLLSMRVARVDAAIFAHDATSWVRGLRVAGEGRTLSSRITTWRANR